MGASARVDIGYHGCAVWTVKGGAVLMAKVRPTITGKLRKQVNAEAERSSCERLNVGAIIHDERGVILSSGYNGALPGMPHCNHECDCGAGNEAQSHAVGCAFMRPCEETLHAEANAILWAARRGIAVEGASIITTHSPCYSCAQFIIQAGIKSVRVLANYRDPSGLILLQTAGLTVRGKDDPDD